MRAFRPSSSASSSSPALLQRFAEASCLSAAASCVAAAPRCLATGSGSRTLLSVSPSPRARRTSGASCCRHARRRAAEQLPLRAPQHLAAPQLKPSTQPTETRAHVPAQRRASSLPFVHPRVLTAPFLQSQNRGRRHGRALQRRNLEYGKQAGARQDERRTTHEPRESRRQRGPHSYAPGEPGAGDDNHYFERGCH